MLGHLSEAPGAGWQRKGPAEQCPLCPRRTRPALTQYHQVRFIKSKLRSSLSAEPGGQACRCERGPGRDVPLRHMPGTSEDDAHEAADAVCWSRSP